MNVLLIATYEQGHQPFGLASPAAWLRAVGAKVACLDISRDPLNEIAIKEANLIAIHVPMHTATRLAIELIAPIRAINPQAHLCFYGLYAPVNADYLRKQGVQTILGGEFEAGLASLANRLATHPNKHADPQSEPLISLARLNFQIPDRQDLPPLDRYASLRLPDGTSRIAGYTESSRGCKHLCRHCPIVPVYNGAFRIVAKEIVLEDIRRQIKAGAQHITFGDPDFFNGVGHAIPLIESLRKEFPHLTYDATIKIEHLRKHENQIAKLRDTNCLFITSAVESIDDAVLEKLAKNHTPQRFRTRPPRLPRPQSPAPTNVRPVLPVDHSRFLQRPPGFPGSKRSDRKRSPHPISHPPPNPRRLAPLRSTGYPKPSRPLRRKSPSPSVATSRPKRRQTLRRSPANRPHRRKTKSHPPSNLRPHPRSRPSRRRPRSTHEIRSPPSTSRPRHNSIPNRALVLLSRTNRGPVGPHNKTKENDSPSRDIRLNRYRWRPAGIRRAPSRTKLATVRGPQNQIHDPCHQASIINSSRELPSFQ